MEGYPARTPLECALRALRWSARKKEPLAHYNWNDAE